MPLDENTIWRSHDGRKTALKDLEDTHLANIIGHLRTRRFPGDDMIEPVLLRIAASRGLTQAFLDRAEIPYRDSEGRWCLHCRPISDPALPAHRRVAPDEAGGEAS